MRTWVVRRSMPRSVRNRRNNNMRFFPLTSAPPGTVDTARTCSDRPSCGDSDRSGALLDKILDATEEILAGIRGGVVEGDVPLGVVTKESRTEGRAGAVPRRLYGPQEATLAPASRTTETSSPSRGLPLPRWKGVPPSSFACPSQCGNDD